MEKRARCSEEHIEEENQGYIDVSTLYFLEIRKNRDVIITHTTKTSPTNVQKKTPLIPFARR